MADDKVEGRELTWRGLLPWTELFRGFQIALDLNKLLLAAAGIVVMAFGWWLLSLIFGAGYGPLPIYTGSTDPNDPAAARAFQDFKHERNQWNLMHEAANAGTIPGGGPAVYEVEDIATRLEEYNLLKKENVKTVADYDALVRKLQEGNKEQQAQATELAARAPLYAKLGKEKPPAGQLSTWPWSENRGPNPFLLVTGQTGVQWEAGHFWDWFSRHQFPVMIEPLVKFMRPIIYFFHPGAGFWPKVYFLLVGLWTVVTWAVFGGAITRIAAVQAARGEKIGWTEALRFTGKRLLSYVSAPIFPMLFLFALLVLLVIFGFLVLIPFVGDFVAGFLWVGPLVLGLIMAVVLVGLVGWPLMSATISAEGTDSWEAVSRSYSYVYQKPWHYIWYSLVAICYGAVLVFFVGFMGSLMVYLAKWGVASTPGIEKANRDPSFLFVYAPDSFGWRPLLLQGVTTDQGPVVSGGQINPNAYKAYTDTFHWWNYVAAGLIAFWLGLIFLLILGFGYSYFWSAGTLIYLLMRRNVDAAELDEVYLEEDEHEGPYTPAPAPPPPPASAIKQGGSVTMVESPALRTVPPSASAPAPAPLPAPAPIPAAAPAAPSPVETPPSAEAAPVPAPDGDVSAAPPPTGDGATSDK